MVRAAMDTLAPQQAQSKPEMRSLGSLESQWASADTVIYLSEDHLCSAVPMVRQGAIAPLHGACHREVEI
jgi:hypothetical protein